MTASPYLVLLETSGNQNFIFSTNKLKENIGASELTYRAGTRWVLDAVADINDTPELRQWANSEDLRGILRNQNPPNLNPPLEQGHKPLEIIIATSGKALILARTEDDAKSLIRQVTQRAIAEAPGLNLSGVFVQIQDWDQTNSLDDAIRQVHKTFEETQPYRPTAEARFLRLPIIADCSFSGLPASHLERTPDNDQVPISQVSASKREAASRGLSRLHKIAPNLIRDINKLEKKFDSEEIPWLAIVHADGNGLGQIFLNFAECLENQQSNRDYIEAYREFSLELDECTEAAFREAVKSVFDDFDDAIPLVPLIIGGDDLTVVCDGKKALKFTQVFLKQFEAETEQKSYIPEIAQSQFQANRLSACAGIAIIKRHFPFSVAYELAESLIKSAKSVKQTVTKPNSKPKTPFPCSAIDFHILYDSTQIDFDRIRRNLQPETTTYLYNRPYVVTELDKLDSAQGKDWASQHHWNRLCDRVNHLKSDDEGDSAKLPSSQAHALRTALFLGRDAANAQYALIQQRYPLKPFAEDDDKTSLFYQTQEKDEIRFHTTFLDALDAKDFF
ncbi:MAG: Inner centromere protein, ARK binding region [Phormidium sp. OSCR]|nr:MAG: Inner centromere protein, ARK binding region [Phormidium sp. OSCR]